MARVSSRCFPCATSMPLADFTVTVRAEEDETPWQVRVVVHKSVRALRSAVTQYDSGRNVKDPEGGGKPVGVCHRFHYSNPKTGWVSPLVALVRLAPPYLGGGVVAHELCHAVTWIREIEQDFKPAPMLSDNDERFCWLLGELVSVTTTALYASGVYTNEPEVVDG